MLIWLENWFCRRLITGTDSEVSANGSSPTSAFTILPHYSDCLITSLSSVEANNLTRPQSLDRGRGIRFMAAKRVLRPSGNNLTRRTANSSASTLEDWHVYFRLCTVSMSHFCWVPVSDIPGFVQIQPELNNKKNSAWSRRGEVIKCKCQR